MVTTLISAQTATELSVKSDDYINNLLARINDEIIEAAKKGRFKIYIQDYVNGAVIERIKSILYQNGYSIIIQNGDEYFITWFKPLQPSISSGKDCDLKNEIP